MENSVPLSFLMWLIGSVITLLGGCWAIFKYFESKINRMYKRMDDNKEIYYKVFVSKEVYESEVRGRKEIIDLKFEQQMTLLNEKIENLRNEIRAFASTAATAAATAASAAVAAAKKN